MRQKVGLVLLIIVGAYGIVYSLIVLGGEFGQVGLCLGFFFFPIAALVPLYGLAVYGWWLPALIIYGGGFLAKLLMDD